MDCLGPPALYHGDVLQWQRITTPRCRQSAHQRPHYSVSTGASKHKKQRWTVADTNLLALSPWVISNMGMAQNDRPRKLNDDWILKDYRYPSLQIGTQSHSHVQWVLPAQRPQGCGLPLRWGRTAVSPAVNCPRFWWFQHVEKPRFSGDLSHLSPLKWDPVGAWAIQEMPTGESSHVDGK